MTTTSARDTTVKSDGTAAAAAAAATKRRWLASHFSLAPPSLFCIPFFLCVCVCVFECTHRHRGIGEFWTTTSGVSFENWLCAFVMCACVCVCGCCCGLIIPAHPVTSAAAAAAATLIDRPALSIRLFYRREQHQSSSSSSRECIKKTKKTATFSPHFKSWKKRRKKKRLLLHRYSIGGSYINRSNDGTTWRRHWTRAKKKKRLDVLCVELSSVYSIARLRRSRKKEKRRTCRRGEERDLSLSPYSLYKATGTICILVMVFFYYFLFCNVQLEGGEEEEEPPPPPSICVTSLRLLLYSVVRSFVRTNDRPWTGCKFTWNYCA